MNDEGGKRKQTESGNCCADGSDVPQPVGLRCLIQDDFGFDRILLAYNWVFLPGLSIVLWTIFLAIR